MNITDGIQLISRLRLRLEFLVLFQHGAPDVIVQPVQIWKLCVFSMNRGQFCMTLER